LIAGYGGGSKSESIATLTVGLFRMARQHLSEQQAATK
jgi:hypothetical protein